MGILTSSSAIMAQSPQWVGLWAFSADGDADNVPTTGPTDNRRSLALDKVVQPSGLAGSSTDGAELDVSQLAAEIFNGSAAAQGFGEEFSAGNMQPPAYFSATSPVQRLMALVLQPEVPGDGAAATRERDIWLSELASRLEVAHHDDLTAGAAGIALLFDRTARSLDAACSNLKQARLIMEQTWPLLSRHLLLDEAIVYPLCGYVGQSYAGPEDSLELLFGSLEREHQQISAALEMMRHKVSQVPLDKHCPKLIELAQAIEFFGYAWETHATKVDKVLLPRLRHVLKGPAGDGIPDAGRHAGNRY